jgi:hypothetical protein
MVYYMIHVKGLHNSTGYIDVCLEDGQLLKDYVQFLDLGMRACRIYNVVNPASARDSAGQFAINLTDVAAISVQTPAKAKT